MNLSHRNEGAIALARTEKTQAEIAARIGKSRTLVAYWLKGERVPGTADRLAIEKVYRVPRDAWDRRPKANGVARGHRARDVTTTTTTPSPPASTAVDVSVHARARELARDVDELRASLRNGDGSDDNPFAPTPLERAKVLASCASTLKLLGTMTGETLEIGEARILRLPAWTRIQEAIVRALTPFGKEVLVAVGEELQRLGGGQVG